MRIRNLTEDLKDKTKTITMKCDVMTRHQGFRKSTIWCVHCMNFSKRNKKLACNMSTSLTKQPFLFSENNPLLPSISYINCHLCFFRTMTAKKLAKCRSKWSLKVLNFHEGENVANSRSRWAPDGKEMVRCRNKCQTAPNISHRGPDPIF